MFRPHRSNTTYSSDGNTSDVSTQATITTPDTDAALIKRFDEYYDDSSDEEDINEKISGYEIDKKWLDKSKSAACTHGKNGLNNNELLSFVAHAAGIRLYHSKAVNAEYYAKKRAMLRDQRSEHAASIRLAKLVHAAIVDSSTKAREAIVEFMQQTGEKTLTAKKFKLLYEKINLEFMQKIDGLIKENKPALIRWLQRIKLINSSKFSYLPKKSDEIIKLETSIVNILIEIFCKRIPVKFAHTDREAIKNEVLQLAISAFESFAVKLKFDRMEHGEGKAAALQKLGSENSPYANLLREIKSILQKSSARGYVNTMILKALEEPAVKEKFIQSYLKDLLQIRNGKKKSSLLVKKEVAALGKYFQLNKESLSEELKISFAGALEISFESAVTALRRPTLGESCTLKSENPFSFLSNLRLANRSQKRHTENLNSASIKKKKYSVFRTWKLATQDTDAGGVIEKQEIFDRSSGRRDMVESLGNYEEIYDYIRQIKGYFLNSNEPVTDQSIAKFIRKIFIEHIFPDMDVTETTKDEINAILEEITYLLFGCEATRNPALHIINQMLLDLIIANKGWTFQEALTGQQDGSNGETGAKLMPMSPEGAVAAVRSLESDFRKYMPYSYTYPGVEDNDDNNSKYSRFDLMKAEARVVREWIKLKIPATEMPAKISAEWILELIENNHDKWFGAIPAENKKKHSRR